MIPSLPFEIWLTVMDFIPSDDHLKLCSVNRDFFEIIMNERYRSVQLQRRRDIIKNLELLV